MAEARDGLKKKSFSAVELADAHVAAIEKARALNAYVLETPERAAAMAKASDARIAAGKAGPLEGIPLAIKDMFCTEGVRTTACSHILDNFVPTYEFDRDRAICGATARCCSARPTMTSSPWARRTRPRISAR